MVLFPGSRDPNPKIAALHGLHCTGFQTAQCSGFGTKRYRSIIAVSGVIIYYQFQTLVG